MAEEFLDGQELSVEGFSAFGKHQILQITTKETTGAPHFIETGHRQPTVLSSAEEGDIKRCVTFLLDLIGHVIGPSHTELRLTSRGPRIIETHTRPGGDGISDLTELTTGVDVFQETLKVLHSICERGYTAASEIYREPTLVQKGVASSHFFLWEPELLEAVNGIQDARKVPGLVQLEISAQLGKVLPTPTDSTTRHGHFIVEAMNSIDLDERVRRVREMIQRVFKRIT
jgi:biotin carboxylase